MCETSMIIKAEKVIITRHDVSRFPLTVLIRFINGHLYRYSVALSLSRCVYALLYVCVWLMILPDNALLADLLNSRSLSAD